MARLYTGLDAIGLGNAVHNIHNGIGARNTSALQLLGGELKDYFAQRAEEQREAAQRKSAIDYLMGRGGIGAQEAEGLVGAIGAPDAVKYIAGKNDEQAIYNRSRKDAIDDRNAVWAHELEDWAKKNGITYGQAVKQMQFSQLMQQLGLITSKDWGNSRKGVDQYNDTIKTLQDFAKKNPEFTAILGAINPSFGNGGNNGFYDEDIQGDLRKFGSKDYTDDDREEYLKRLIEHDKFNYIIGNPIFQDAILTFGTNVDKKNLMKQVNLQRLLGNTVTETQRNKQRENADWATHVKNLAKQIEETYGDRTHTKKFPKLNEKELAAMKDIFKKDSWKLNHYLKK